MRRRAFIKGSAAGLACKAFLPPANAAEGLAHTAVPAPAPALAWGFNNLALYDDFLSSNTIDLNNTRDPKFTWFTGFANGIQGQPWTPPNYVMSATPVAASAISVSGSVLTLQNNAGLAGWQGLSSALFDSSSGNLTVGRAFSNGIYIEAAIAFDPTLSPGGSGCVSWPAFSFTTYTAFIQGHFPTAELDFFEAFPNGSGAIIPTMAFNWWVSDFYSSGDLATNRTPSLGAVDWTQFQRIGCLWVPMSRNGGTGLIRRYLNGSEITSCEINYTTSGPATFPNGGSLSPSNPNGALSTLDSQVNPLFLYGATGWPLRVDSIQVWTP